MISLTIRIFSSILAVALSSLFLTSKPALSQAWPQWAQNPQHTGFLDVAGQNLNQNLVNIVYDPLVPAEMAANGGDLLVHYQTPLVDANDVFMESKSGTYSTSTYSTERWHQNRFQWQSGQLVSTLVVEFVFLLAKYFLSCFGSLS